MSVPIALVAALADRVLAYLDQQTLTRQPTDEEIRLAGDARRVQAAAAEADASRPQSGDAR